jgi:hypothetical protein
MSGFQRLLSKYQFSQRLNLNPKVRQVRRGRFPDSPGREYVSERHSQCHSTKPKDSDLAARKGNVDSPENERVEDFAISAVKKFGLKFQKGHSKSAITDRVHDKKSRLAHKKFPGGEQKRLSKTPIKDRTHTKVASRPRDSIKLFDPSNRKICWLSLSDIHSALIPAKSQKYAGERSALNGQ